MFSYINAFIYMYIAVVLQYSSKNTSSVRCIFQIIRLNIN